MHVYVLCCSRLKSYTATDRCKVCVMFQGVVASGMGYLLLTYCVEKRGPVFTAAFSPLSQIFVAGIDLFILHEPLYLGRSQCISSAP